MKIRNGYVSNRSSSSFIVTMNLINYGIACLKLTEAQKKLINGSKMADDLIINLDLKRDFWLTEFIFDGNDEKWEKIMDVGHQLYAGGQMCGEPYSDESFNEYQIDGDRSVYLRKEHDDAKQMKFSKFAKEFKENHDPSTEVIVKYEKNGDITLKAVEI